MPFSTRIRSAKASFGRTRASKAYSLNYPSSDAAPSAIPYSGARYSNATSNIRSSNAIFSNIFSSGVHFS